MKLKLILLALFLLFGAVAFSQTFDENNPPVLIQSTKVINGKYKTIYSIRVTFTAAVEDSNLTTVRNPGNWQVWGVSKTYSIDTVQLSFKKNKCNLVGNWDIYDNLFLRFKGGSEKVVKTDEATGKTTHWGFGKGEAFDVNVQRLASQKNLFAFQHQIKVKAIERNLTLVGNGIWLRSLSLDVISNGTFASDDTVRNGTQSSIGLALNPYYFAAGLIYRSEFNFSYQVETRMNQAEDQLFDVIDQKMKLGVELELPFTNYPIYKLHTRTGYARLAMPLTIDFNYLFGGNGDGTFGSFDRLDFGARYELAFSPYLIVQGEWQHSKFLNAPVGFDDSANFYSIAFAQDLDAVKKTLGFLKFVLGPEDEMRGKNFIFFRISNGRKAPAFQDVDEKAFGFGTYF